MQVKIQAAPLAAKSKMKLNQIIPLVIIVVSAIGVLYFSGFLDGSNQGDFFTDFGDGAFADSDKLTPTRDIDGTWSTTFATEFIIATDYEQFGVLADVGTEDRTMTWTITPTDNEHYVYVYIEFSVSNRQLVSGSGYVPDVSPMMLTGVVNGTQLILTKDGSGPIEQYGSIGEFTFTDKFMEGTWHDHWEGVWEQNVYTNTNGLKLTKQ